MIFDVAPSEGKVLLDVDKPVPCCLTLEPREAIALAARLLNAALDVEEGDGCGFARKP
jgi:hypothetical protein